MLIKYIDLIFKILLFIQRFRKKNAKLCLLIDHYDSNKLVRHSRSIQLSEIFYLIEFVVFCQKYFHLADIVEHNKIERFFKSLVR